MKELPERKIGENKSKIGSSLVISHIQKRCSDTYLGCIDILSLLYHDTVK